MSRANRSAARAVAASAASSSGLRTRAGSIEARPSGPTRTTPACSAALRRISRAAWSRTSAGVLAFPAPMKAPSTREWIASSVLGTCPREAASPARNPIASVTAFEARLGSAENIRWRSREFVTPPATSAMRAPWSAATARSPGVPPWVSPLHTPIPRARPSGAATSAGTRAAASAAVAPRVAAVRGTRSAAPRIAPRMMARLGVSIACAITARASSSWRASVPPPVAQVAASAPVTGSLRNRLPTAAPPSMSGASTFSRIAVVNGEPAARSAARAPRCASTSRT